MSWSPPRALDVEVDFKATFRRKEVAQLCALARVRPAFLQNRCFARTGWDGENRRICRERAIACQGFSLLTANREVLSHPGVIEMARRKERTVPQLVFAFALAVDIIPLTGTTDPEHMRQDLDAYELELTPQEVGTIEGAGR